MTKQTAQQWILFLDRNQIQLYHPLFKEIIKVTISETLLKDLEVLKPVDLEKLMEQTMAQTKIPTTDPVFIILSNNVILNEVYPNATKESLKDKLEMIIKMAPFNHVGWTTMQSGKNLLLVMTNREVYEAFQEIMERLGYRVNAVTPQVMTGVSGELTRQTAGEIIKRTPLVKQHSLIYDPDQALEHENQMSSDPRKNRKLLLLLLALLLLVVVLGGLVIKMYLFPDKPTPEASTTPVVTSMATPTLETTPTQTASPAPTLAAYRVQILNASGKAGLAESTKQTLNQNGFSQVETGNSDVINSERVQVVFAPTVPNKVREAVLSALSSGFPNPASREQPGLPFDVIITLTNAS